MAAAAMVLTNVCVLYYAERDATRSAKIRRDKITDASLLPNSVTAYGRDSSRLEGIGLVSLL